MQFTFSGFGGLTSMDCTLTITHGQQTQRSRQSLPQEIWQMQFQSLMQDAANSRDPIAVRLSRMVPIRAPTEEQLPDREVFIEFLNKAYVAAHGA